MRVPLRVGASFGEYLKIERTCCEVKHEFVQGSIFAVGRGSVEHSALAAAVVGLLFEQLRGGPYRLHGGELALSIREADVATRADVVVVCQPIRRDPASLSHVTNPRVVVEVLDPSTERYDRGPKRRFYQELESLCEYVLVAQDRRRVELWRREGEGWVHSVCGAEGTVYLTSIGCQLDVDVLYDAAGVFPSA
ncbi:MAG: Uma2 family endonuclease [Myxococcota bacterium]